MAVASVPCRSWKCQDCEPRRRAQLIAECHRGAPNTFLTLTLRRIPGRTPEQAAQVLSRAWRLLRLRIMRHRKWRKLPFGYVVEAHESGYPHAHILLRSLWIDKHWLSAQMADIADSPIVDIRRIDDGAKVNAYVAKYAGKAAHRFGNSKRYYFSQDYRTRARRPFRPVFDRPGKWQIEPCPIVELQWRYHDLGYSLEWRTKRHFLAKPP